MLTANPGYRGMSAPVVKVHSQATPHPALPDLHLKAVFSGLLGSKAIKWNFTKFLIGKDGQVIKRYAPTDKPAGLARDVELALAA